MNCRVAIIDSGINNHLVSKSTKLYTIFDNNYFDENGHGSKCISLIKMISPKTEIISFKLLDKNLKCTTQDLYSTLVKMLNIDVDIINLSLSTSNNEQFTMIDEICYSLLQQGKIIIASKANNGEISYPAESKYVIGVSGNQFKSNENFWFSKNNSIQCIASRTPCIVDLGNQEYTFYSGNSKATACMTGIISKNFASINNLCIQDKIEYILSLATRNEWEESEILTEIIADSSIEVAPVDNLKIMDFIKSLFIDFGLNESDKYIYKLIGTIKIINMVKVILKEFNLNFNNCEFNLYDFISVKSLYNKINSLVKAKEDGSGNNK